MNLETLVLEHGFSVLKKNHVNIESTKIDILHFKRLAKIEHEEMSEYFLVDINNEIANILFKNYDLKDFKSFQEKLMSDVFFEYKNDIRWNFYLILLIRENEFGFNIPIREIEKDTNFARKYIFNLQELKDFLKGTIFSSIENIDSVTSSNENPESVWINELHQHNLSACLTQSFQENNIDFYLATKKFNDSNLSVSLENTSDINKAIPIIKKVTELNLGQVGRPCFRGEQILEPVQINLLHGANGTGKTTFLETIELAITGENNRSKLFKESSNMEVLITCFTSEGFQNFSSKKTPSESKKLENKWYGTPIGRGRTTLNQNFALFNYFDTDKSYRFALEEIDEEDDSNQYLNRFSQLIFGDRIIKMQKNWLRYKLGFETRYKRLLSTNEELFNEIEYASKNIEEIKELNPINNNYLIDCYNKIFLKHKFEEKPFLTEEDIKYSIETFEFLKEPLEKISDESIGNMYNKLIPIEIENSHEILNSKLSELSDTLILSSNKKESIEAAISNLKTRIQENHVQITTSLKTLEEIENSRTEWHKHKNVISQQEAINQRESLLIDIKQIDSDLKLINYANKNWPEISEINEISSYTSTIDLNKLKDNISLISQDVKEYEKKIIDYKKYVGELEELQIKIKNLGMEYLTKDPIENCPLCDANHNNNQELINKINNKSYTKEESFLLEVSKAKSDLIQKLAIYKNQYENELKKSKVRNSILDCSNKIFNSFQTTDINIDQLYYKILDFLNKEPILIDRKKQFSSLLKFIEEDGINQETINSSKLFIEKDLFYKLFIEQKNTFEYEDFLLELESKHNNVITKNKNHTQELSNILIHKKVELQNIKNFISKILAERTIIKDKVKMVDEINHSINQLNNYLSVDKNEDLFIWEKDLKLFQSNLLKAMNYHNHSKEIEKERENLKFLKLKQKKNQEYLEICENAIEILSNLPRHEVFVETFIKENLSKIEYLFRAIHSPKEFATLEFDRTGIIATRENNGIKAKAHQMSTGQRVSLALSVMFTHFLAAPNAPDVLLLDEPVANMDDLHLLNLLDIIRELALRGTQIIFTTANPDVAGLFRRKFSFFGNEFKKFEFIRGEDGFTTIQEITYSPGIEEEIVIRSV